MKLTNTLLRRFQWSPATLALAFTLFLFGAVACGEEDPVATPEPVSPSPTATIVPPPDVDVAAEPRDISLLVGAGKDTTVINAYLPADITVRAGDTVSWTVRHDQIHTVTFTSGAPTPLFMVPLAGKGYDELMVPPHAAFSTMPPGAPTQTYRGTGYVSSGIMSPEPPNPETPPNGTFSLTFGRPGIFDYVCIVHPFMAGSITVEPATIVDVPTQADLDAQAARELAIYTARIDDARRQGENGIVESGPGGSTIWKVRSGNLELNTGDYAAEARDFMPKDLTVDAGDSVIWDSPTFHTVSFLPKPPPPEFVVPIERYRAPPIITLNPDVVAPSKPSATYDPTMYFNSGVIGPFSTNGLSWTLAFDEPGVYNYVCLLHREQGMEGTITVRTKNSAARSQAAN